MAGASDKARFHLEQSIPELHELERKKIFTKKQEIMSIAKKRSDFEHKINARGSYPSDYAKYAEYEINLDSLRRKRTKRLGVKSSNHTGQRRIFSVLQRATHKFHGDIGLWMQYIAFVRKQKSYKKVSDILTQVLRLHPTKPELWIHAANYALEESGDMTEARGYMRRGLRFCKRSEKLWIEYARLEMIYVAKVAARSKVLGLEMPVVAQKRNEDGKGSINNSFGLTTVTPEDLGGQDPLERLSGSPALSAAIPMALFDAAMEEFNNESQIAWTFFDMVAETDAAPRYAILGHIIDKLQSTTPDSPETQIRYVRQPVIGLAPTSAKFPVALGTSLERLKATSERLSTAQSRHTFYSQVAEWVSVYREADGLDPDIRKVLEVTLKKAHDQCLAIHS